MVREFNFKKSFEEIKINGEVYRLDMSDDKLKEYQKSFNEFHTEYQKLQEVDTDKLSKQEELEYFDQSLELVKKTIEKLLGEGKFNKLYEDSGRSLFNMMDLITFLSDLAGEKFNNTRQEKYNKYTKNKNKYRTSGNKR